MASGKRRRRGAIWALSGAAVLAIAIVVILASGLLGRTPDPAATAIQASDPTSTSIPTEGPDDAVVDEGAAESGWVPEPITTNPETYIRAALAAAAAFDTQKSSRRDWLEYLDTWFTPDTRYASEQDREDDMRASQLELRQAVVLPEGDWDSLANEDGRVVASVAGEIAFGDVPDDTAGDMMIGTADVVLTYTRADADGGESSYEEMVRVSVQVLCGEGSIPTPNTAQQSGDCKVVRYYSGSLEP